jgi:hypothetical protein
MSFLSFLIDPGEETSADTGRGLERIAEHGGLDGCRFLAALAQFGTGLPDAVTGKAVSSLEKMARRTRDRYSRVPVEAARILVDFDRARGLDVLTSMATDRRDIERGFDALRQIAALDRERGADLLAAVAADTESSPQDRFRAARRLHRLDRDRSGDLLQAMASDSPRWTLRTYAGQLLAELDPGRGGPLLEHIVLDINRDVMDRSTATRPQHPRLP